MRKMQFRTAIFVSAAMLAGGCASQNAMTMIPGNLKAEIAAEKAARAPEKGAVSVEAMLAAARKDKAGSKPADTDAEPMKAAGDAADAAAAQDARAEPIRQPSSSKAPPARKPAPRVLPIAENFEEAGYEGVTAPDVWARFREMQAKAAEASAEIQATAPDMMATAALPQKPRGDPADVRFSGEALDRDSDLKLRLMVSAGRKAERIIVGKVEAATPFEALAAAQARAMAIRRLTGGEPDISYDPALAADGAVVHFARNLSRKG